ncbi:MAG: SAM-dependent methyltransferase, partial [Parvularcula sp.]|nr:SAM-dependent methyltransferase [Parvularcula sp.]
LAALGGTIVVYMGMTRAGEVARQLIDAGLPRALPVAVISEGTRPTEKIIRARLEQLGDAAAAIPAPGLLVIGEVAAKARGEELLDLVSHQEAA